MSGLDFCGRDWRAVVVAAKTLEGDPKDFGASPLVPAPFVGAPPGPPGPMPGGIPPGGIVGRSKELSKCRKLSERESRRASDVCAVSVGQRIIIGSMDAGSCIGLSEGSIETSLRRLQGTWAVRSHYESRTVTKCHRARSWKEL